MAPASINACCSGCGSSAVPIPSMVSTVLPSASMANTQHELTARPSMMTVQAPHSPRSQPFFAPVRCARSRSTCRSVSCGSTVNARLSPLSVRWIVWLFSSMMFYLLCRICCLFRIGPFPPLCALRQVSHSPESGRLMSSFSPAGIFFPARAQPPSRALFWYGQQYTIYFAQNQAFKLRRIHSTFVHYVLKRLSTLFPTLERGVPPRLSPHQK